MFSNAKLGDLYLTANGKHVAFQKLWNNEDKTKITITAFHEDSLKPIVYNQEGICQKQYYAGWNIIRKL